jgi:hypothetical protein
MLYCQTQQAPSTRRVTRGCGCGCENPPFSMMGAGLNFFDGCGCGCDFATPDPHPPIAIPRRDCKRRHAAHSQSEHVQVSTKAKPFGCVPASPTLLGLQSWRAPTTPGDQSLLLQRPPRTFHAAAWLGKINTCLRPRPNNSRTVLVVLDQSPHSRTQPSRESLFKHRHSHLLSSGRQALPNPSATLALLCTSSQESSNTHFHPDRNFAAISISVLF